MPPKDCVPIKVRAKLTDGTFVDVAGVTDIAEIAEWCEQYEFVRVTRCRYCKYYEIEQLKSDYTPDKRYKPSVCTKGKFAVRRDPDWYCADGKRRAEE